MSLLKYIDWIMLIHLVILVTSFCCKSHGLNEEDFVKKYLEVDDYLVNNIRRDDARANLIVAIEWLHDLRDNVTADSGLIEALETITSLSRVFMTNCSFENSMLIRKNHIYCHSRSSDFTLSDRRRVDMLVRGVAQRYARACEPLWKQQHSTILAKLDNEVVDKVNTISNELLHLYTDEDLIPLIDNFVIRNRKLTDHYDSTHIYNGIVRSSIGDPEAKIFEPRSSILRSSTVIDRKILDNLIFRYVIEPCGIYADAFKEVYYASRVDLFVMYENKNIEWSGSFVRDWARFRICDYFSTNKDNLEPFLNAIHNRAIE